MKEVRCLVVTHEGEFHPLRVLIPEAEGDNPRRDCSIVVNSYSNLPFGSNVITSFSDELGGKINGVIDWESARVVDPTPNAADEAYALFRKIGRRCQELEPLIAQDDYLAEGYANFLPKKNWVNWSDEELERNPCWLFMYAQQVMKGKLPDNLHTAMGMHSFNTPQNEYVKKYFKYKRYKYHCKKHLRGEKFYRDGA